MKKIVLLFLFVLVCFIGTNVKALEVRFNGSAFSGSGTTSAENCWQYGCRYKNKGIKVTIKYKKNGKEDAIVKTKTITIDADSNDNISFLGKSISIKKDDIDFTKVNLEISSMIREDKYKLETIEGSRTKVKEFKNTGTYKYFLKDISDFSSIYSNINGASTAQLKKYLKQLTTTYIFVEPVLTFTMPKKDIACIFKEQGITNTCIKDSEIQGIHNTGVGTLSASSPCDLSLDTLKKIGFAASSDTEETKKEYCDNHYDDAQSKKWEKFKTAWNKVVSSPKSLSTESNTVLKWANLLTNNNQ